MLVYIYDEETKEFLREEEAFIDPLETQLKGEDVYLLPANATFEKPLDKEDGKAVIFDGSAWKLVDDNRGKFTIIDGSMQEIETLDSVEKILSDEEVEGLNNGTLVIIDNEVVEKPAPTREEISTLREQAYIKEIDVLHAQKDRKTILGTWTEEDEANYIAEVKRRSEDIANRYPYPEE